MINQDNWLINSCIDNSETVFPNIKCEFPLDNEIKEKLKELATNVKEDSNDYYIQRWTRYN